MSAHNGAIVQCSSLRFNCTARIQQICSRRRTRKVSTTSRDGRHQMPVASQNYKSPLLSPHHHCLLHAEHFGARTSAPPALFDYDIQQRGGVQKEKQIKKSHPFPFNIRPATRKKKKNRQTQRTCDHHIGALHAPPKKRTRPFQERHTQSPSSKHLHLNEEAHD